MKQTSTRREFMQQAGAAAGLAAAGGFALGARAEDKEKPMKRTYGISLAAWSLHRTIGDGEGKVPMLDMPKMARQEWDIEAIELVSGMLASTETSYFDTLAANALQNNVAIKLIMIDGQGDIGHRRDKFREIAVENHKKWIDYAAGLGCHSIRMNWKGDERGTLESPEMLKDFIDRSVPGFTALCEYGDSKNINVLIENHWGPSSYIDPLTSLMKAVGHPRFGTLPDFGNFPDDVDRYEAVDAFMPYAKAVSAKCYDFDDDGNETKIDFEKMLGIVCDKHGYDGYIGIEYEGGDMSESDGIKACNELLKRLRG
ncbi:MAG: TIM barrel protein [Candidatus Hydrogenedens sp.]|nr:TIM barrel protein [Candidatus Hydrogenedens sp.]